MVVLILDKAPSGLRGKLTRWLYQPKAGVFFGWVSARVRDLLWQRVCAGLKEGGAILIYPDDNEQGFSIRTAGEPKVEMVDFDGLILPKTRNRRE
jgi:CRISPR-associated protein Cas2